MVITHITKIERKHLTESNKGTTMATSSMEEGNRNGSRGLTEGENSCFISSVLTSLLLFRCHSRSFNSKHVDAPKPSDSLFDSLAFDLFFGCSWDSGERIFVLLKLRSFEKPQLDSQNVEKCRRVIDVWMLAKNMKAAMGVIFEN